MSERSTSELRLVIQTDNDLYSFGLYFSTITTIKGVGRNWRELIEKAGFR